MPAPIEEFTTLTSEPQIVISLEPAYNAFQSLTMLIKVAKLSGFGAWLQETWDKLSPSEQNDHKVVFSGLHYVVAPRRSYSSFPAYMNDLATSDPVKLRDQMLDMYARLEHKGDKCVVRQDTPDYDKTGILSSFAAYLDFLRKQFQDENIDVEVERQAYNLVIDPTVMLGYAVNHLQHMWETYFEKEWERVHPMLNDAVRAFQQINFKGMSKLEAVRIITGQDPDECLEEALIKAERVVFIPSAHIGPYVGRFNYSTDTLGVMFGARLPEGVYIDAPDLSRNDILVRLSALADDNRLRILKFIADNGEQRSQDIMTELELSQSAASRHLKQLSATGFLTERRCEGAKCYTLNNKKLNQTLSAVQRFLLEEDVQEYNYTGKRTKVYA